MDTLLGLVPVLLLGTGFFYLFRLRGFYLLHPIRCLGTLRTAGAGEGISPMRALSVALAGTLGVGNIVGVAAALYFGGTGVRGGNAGSAPSQGQGGDLATKGNVCSLRRRV